MINLNDYPNKEFPIYLDGHAKFITALALSNDDKCLATGDSSGYIILWDWKKCQAKDHYNFKLGINNLIFSNDNTLLGTTQNDLIFIFSIIDATYPFISLKGHTNNIIKILFTQNSNYLISGSYDKTVKIWNVKQQTNIQNKLFQELVVGIDISLDQQHISVCLSDGCANLFHCFEISNIKKLVSWQAHIPEINGIRIQDFEIVFFQAYWHTTFTSDSKILITSFYNKVKLWSINKLLKRNDTPPLRILHRQFDEWAFSIKINNKSFIFNDGTIKIANIVNQKLIRQIDYFDLNSYNQIWLTHFVVPKNMKYIITPQISAKLAIYKIANE